MEFEGPVDMVQNIEIIKIDRVELWRNFIPLSIQ